jgi:hypothetical protein
MGSPSISCAFLSCFLFLSSSWAYSSKEPALRCSFEAKRALQILQNPRNQIEAKQEAAKCLVRSHLSREAAAKEILSILQSKEEDLFLREDIMTALADHPWRRSIQVQGKVAPALNQSDREALVKAVGPASSILDLASSLKEMREIVPTTQRESEIIRTVSLIVLDDQEVLALRQAGVRVLTGFVEKAVESGLWQEKTIRMAQETLLTLKQREDVSSWSTGAEEGYEKLAARGRPFFAGGEQRSLASEKPKPPSLGGQKEIPTTRR